VADVLVDASALVALLDRDDRSHDAAVAARSPLRGRLVTVWPLSEAMHLLGDFPAAQKSLFEMVEDAAVAVAALDADDLPRMKALMRSTGTRRWPSPTRHSFVWRSATISRAS
jgi:hypothetical protein